MPRAPGQPGIVVVRPHQARPKVGFSGMIYHFQDSIADGPERALNKRDMHTRSVK